jgi:hypothetical protein
MTSSRRYNKKSRKRPSKKRPSKKRQSKKRPSKKRQSKKRQSKKRQSKKRPFWSLLGGYYTDTILGKTFINYPNVKFTRLNEHDTANIVRKIQQNIPECCNNESITYATIFEKLSNNWSIPIFIIGGSVRDYMTTKSIGMMNDIDISYTIHPTLVHEALAPLPITSFYKNEKNYIRIGPKHRNDHIEGFYRNPFENFDYQLECKMNSLMFMIDYKDGEYIIHLVDFFGGEALEQAEHKIWEAPTTNYTLWLKSFDNNNLLWRLLKFELRGYTVPLETKRAVYQHFIHDSNIREHTWQKMWSIISPDKLDLMVDLIIRDCEEVGLDSTILINKLIAKKLIAVAK